MNPFWEKTYADDAVSTFQKGPTVDVAQFYGILPTHTSILDVGCGEGRNAIFLAEKGHICQGFDLSQAGIDKAKK